MARSQASDFIHNFRFHVTTGNLGDSAEAPLLPAAGFNSVTTPEYTVEAVEYREGIYTFTRKYAGLPTTNDLTMSRGVTKKDTEFFDWLTASIAGDEYRTTITISHFHKDDGLNALDASIATAEMPLASKSYICHEAIPTRVKPAADLDGTAGDVSLAEVDVAFEHFTIEVAE